MYIQKHVLAQTGFDIFRSPQFLEHMALKECGATPVEGNGGHDGTLSDGRTVEIKSSNPIQVGTKHKTYRFSRMLTIDGRARADLYVLVAAWKGELVYHVLAGPEVEKRKTMQRTFPEAAVMTWNAKPQIP